MEKLKEFKPEKELELNKPLNLLKKIRIIDVHLKPLETLKLIEENRNKINEIIDYLNKKGKPSF